MNAAVEIPIWKAYAQSKRKYYVDPWFVNPVSEIIEIGKQYCTYIVLSSGVSIHMEPDTLVYYEDKR